MKHAKSIMDARNLLIEGVDGIDGIGLVAKDVEMSGLAIRSTSNKVNILIVADLMEEYGWKIERQQLPDCIHATLMPAFAPNAPKFVADLATCVARHLKAPGAPKKGSAAMYGMVAAIPDEAVVEDFLLDMFGEIFTN
jgi:sphinganine-1-phosphate aldolase